MGLLGLGECDVEFYTCLSPNEGVQDVQSINHVQVGCMQVEKPTVEHSTFIATNSSVCILRAAWVWPSLFPILDQ